MSLGQLMGESSPSPSQTMDEKARLTATIATPTKVEACAGCVGVAAVLVAPSACGRSTHNRDIRRALHSPTKGCAARRAEGGRVACGLSPRAHEDIVLGVGREKRAQREVVLTRRAETADTICGGRGWHEGELRRGVTSCKVFANGIAGRCCSDRNERATQAVGDSIAHPICGDRGRNCLIEVRAIADCKIPTHTIGGWGRPLYLKLVARAVAEAAAHAVGEHGLLDTDIPVCDVAPHGGPEDSCHPDV